jgi:hypothetical protein
LLLWHKYAIVLLIMTLDVQKETRTPDTSSELQYAMAQIFPTAEVAEDTAHYYGDVVGRLIGIVRLEERLDDEFMATGQAQVASDINNVRIDIRKAQMQRGVTVRNGLGVMQKRVGRLVGAQGLSHLAAGQGKLATLLNELQANPITRDDVDHGYVARRLDPYLRGVAMIAHGIDPHNDRASRLALALGAGPQLFAIAEQWRSVLPVPAGHESVTDGLLGAIFMADSDSAGAPYQNFFAQNNQDQLALADFIRSGITDPVLALS